MLHQRYLSNTIVLAFCITGLVLTGCEDGVLDASDELDSVTYQERPEPGSILQDQTSSLPAEKNSLLAKLRNATAHFNNFSKAEEAGYGTRITPCLYHSELGGMGYHYANPALMDGSINLLEPEVLLYEPNTQGRYRLVGLEYIVPFDTWNEDNPHWDDGNPPSLLGQEFLPNDEGGFYALHVWLWRHNPSGMFYDWNPKVSCEHADEAFDVAHAGGD